MLAINIDSIRERVQNWPNSVITPSLGWDARNLVDFYAVNNSENFVEV